MPSLRPPIVIGSDGALYVDVDDDTFAFIQDHFWAERVPESEVLDAICREDGE